MIGWKDESSYSRGERGTREPSVWSLDSKAIRLRVHRLHGVEGLWFLSCYGLALENCQLDAIEIEPAKQEALVRMHRRALYFAEQLDHAMKGKP